MTLQKGFTLIELMVVVAIVAILSAIAIPSYQNNVVSSRRADAQSALQGLAQAMERHYTTSGNYLQAATAGADTGPPQIFATQSPIDGAVANYNLLIHAATANGYTLAAEPIGSQLGDGVLVLKSTGQRGWDRDDTSGGSAASLGAAPNEVAATEWCWSKNGC